VASGKIEGWSSGLTYEPEEVSIYTHFERDPERFKLVKVREGYQQTYLVQRRVDIKTGDASGEEGFSSAITTDVLESPVSGQTPMSMEQQNLVNAILRDYFSSLDEDEKAARLAVQKFWTFFEKELKKRGIEWSTLDPSQKKDEVESFLESFSANVFDELTTNQIASFVDVLREKLERNGLFMLPSDLAFTPIFWRGEVRSDGQEISLEEAERFTDILSEVYYYMG